MLRAVQRIAGFALGLSVMGLSVLGAPSLAEGAPKKDAKKPSATAKSTKRSSGQANPRPPALPALPTWEPPEVRMAGGAVEKIAIPLPNAPAMASLVVLPLGTRDEGDGEEGTLGQIVATMPSASLSRAVARRDEVVVGIGPLDRAAPTWMSATDAQLEALVFQGLPAYAHDATASTRPRASMLAKLRATTPRALCVAGPKADSAEALSLAQAKKPRAVPRLTLQEQTNQRALELVDPSLRSIRLGWAVAPRTAELGLHALALTVLEERLATRLVDAQPTVRARLDRREGPSLAWLSVALPAEADTKRVRERVFRELADLAKTGPSERELHLAKTKSIHALSETFSEAESACFAVAAERRDPARELGAIRDADARSLRLLFAQDLGPQRRSVVTVWSGVDVKKPIASPAVTSSSTASSTASSAASAAKRDAPTKDPPRGKKDAPPKKTGAKRKP